MIYISPFFVLSLSSFINILQFSEYKSFASLGRLQFSSVQLLSSVQLSRSVMSDFLRPNRLQHARLPCQSPTPGLPKLMPIESMMSLHHLILCCPLLLPPSIFPSIRVFSSESVLPIRGPKYWSFRSNISPSNTDIL